MTSRNAVSAIGAAFLVLYVTLGTALGEQYPFSPLHMFARGGQITARIVVRAADGLHEIEDYDRFRCEEAPSFETADGTGCAFSGRHPERDHIAAEYVALHVASAGEGEPVTILR